MEFMSPELLMDGESFTFPFIIYIRSRNGWDMHIKWFNSVKL